MRGFAWTPARVEQLRSLWSRSDITIRDMLPIMGASTVNQLIGKAYKLGLPKRKTGRRRAGPALERIPGANKGFQVHADDTSGLRRFGNHQVTGHSRTRLRLDHPAATDGRTIFPSRVFSASARDRVLKSGMNSSKIGRMVVKGRWRGMPIYTLTLEERATCPRSCREWLTCYGNNMHLAERFRADGEFIVHLWSELLRLQRRHAEGFVVRLHVLGDFFSEGYVALWATALEQLPALRAFGFTARHPNLDPIGRALWTLTEQHWDRFAIRFSGRDAPDMGAVVIGADDKAQHIICPAQQNKTDCCGTCGLCWHSKKTINFLRH